MASAGATFLAPPAPWVGGGCGGLLRRERVNHQPATTASNNTSNKNFRPMAQPAQLGARPSNTSKTKREPTYASNSSAVPT